MVSDEAMGIWMEAQHTFDPTRHPAECPAAATVIDKALAQQREEIAAWLESQATCGCNGKYGWCNTDGPPLAYAAAIRSGEYRKEPDHG